MQRNRKLKIRFCGKKSVPLFNKTSTIVKPWYYLLTKIIWSSFKRMILFRVNYLKLRSQFLLNFTKVPVLTFGRQPILLSLCTNLFSYSKLFLIYLVSMLRSIQNFKVFANPQEDFSKHLFFLLSKVNPKVFVSFF